MSMHYVYNYTRPTSAVVCMRVSVCVYVCVYCGIVHVQVWWLLSNRCVCIDFSSVVVQKLLLVDSGCGCV